MRLPIAIYCTSRAAGGLELNVVRMTAWLREANYPAELLILPDSAIAQQAAKQQLPIVATADSRGRPSLVSLAQTLRRKAYHTLFVHTSTDLRRAVLARILARSKTKLVFVQHMQLGVKKRDFVHTWFFRRLAAWIAPLPYLARQVREMTRFDPNRIHEIPFGAELAPLAQNRPGRSSARRHLNLPTKAVFAGVIGRFDRQKNQALLIRAAAPLIRSGFPLKLLFVGANTLDNAEDYEAELRTLAQETGIANAVYFRPFQHDVRMAYAALDIFVLTSQAETYGMVTIEAMAAGLPVIATRSGGTPELVHDKQEGFLIEPDNAEDLQNALRLLLEFPELRERFGAIAQENALRRFSHRDYVKKIGDLIQSLD